MSVAVDVNGRADSCPPLTYRGSARRRSPAAVTFSRQQARLSGGALDITELESTNAANIPLLRFVVPFNADTESPIAQANYTATVSCLGCVPLPVATGALNLSSTLRPGVALYVLPLALERVPSLRSIVGAGTLSVTLDVKDAAGNATTTSLFSFTFHVVGPPLAITEDTAFSTYGDRWSTHPFPDRDRAILPALGSCLVLWKERPARSLRRHEPCARGRRVHDRLPAGVRRLVEDHRELARIPVQGTGGQFLDDFNSGTLFTPDGFTFMQYPKWAPPLRLVGSRSLLLWAETSAWPCALSYEQGGTPAHRIGDSGSRFVCAPPGVDLFARPTDIETAVFAAGDVNPEIYGEYYPTGGEMVPPTFDVSGQMPLIPAATAAGPGKVVVYLTRSSYLGRARPLLWGRGSGAPRFETWDWQVWNRYFKWTYAYWQYHTFMAYWWGRYLSLSSETLDGNLHRHHARHVLSCAHRRTSRSTLGN